MSISRRQFIHLMGIAGAAGMLPACHSKTEARKAPSDLYEIPKYGNVTLLHMTDCHAQLNPVYFREPSENIGVGSAKGKPPHLVGNKMLAHFGIKPNTHEAHAFTYLDYVEAARKYGKLGGFAHMRTLVNRLRSEYGAGNTLLLDGGDTWQGSGTALWTRGKDMVGASNLLGVDVMTGHWEYTYHESEILDNIKAFKGDFVAQNVKVKDSSMFDYKYDNFPGYNEDTGFAFKRYTMRKVGPARVAVIGQAFPYTPIANPARFIPDWTFGIRDGELQQLINEIREKEKPDVVVLVSHNGMDVDLKMASIVSGLDVIFGGHTHDAIPSPTVVKNPGGQTLVTNAGSNGKFLGVMQLDVRNGKVQDFRYRLVPIFSNLIEPDKEMATYVTKVRAPYKDKLDEELAVAEGLLFRRGNFNGTFDQIICDALRDVNNAQISLSPGFRWGTTVLPGQSITTDDVMNQTCITYPQTYRHEMTGKQIKNILEDVADNLFNKDPYYQQGGDMVRVGGMDYTMDPTQTIGKRVSDMTLDDGTPVDANKKYVVSGWASVNSQAPGRPVWEIVHDYLVTNKVARIKKLNTPKLKNVAGNPGLADYPPKI